MENAGVNTRENRLAVNSLMLASAARNFAISVRQQSEQEIWLQAYAGDFGANPSLLAVVAIRIPHSWSLAELSVPIFVFFRGASPGTGNVGVGGG